MTTRTERCSGCGGLGKAAAPRPSIWCEPIDVGYMQVIRRSRPAYRILAILSASAYGTLKSSVGKRGGNGHRNEGIGG